ncbi:transmembrane amino acid transporter protein-domain-containing protein [Aspergillus avenaceus]|uniref:Transmembrane amino acid transporter protein-domain-containing protein n=1 Tax=Aspergillus avenaceus TaxID=36643 RepID=A0A5N6TNL8_ASPAV|nr:transmembrane amino acid transporter protein-domain-containing protein [Aspergillus avenaceus]
MSTPLEEVKDFKITQGLPTNDDIAIANADELKPENDSFEVFKKGDGQVDFRTVSWLRASAIFLKMLFATGILSIPSVMYDLGAFPGAVNLVGWCAINAYGAIILGNFRNAYPQCHSVADMAQLIGGPVLREIVGFIFIVTYVITAASGIIGVSAAFNALSLHAFCTVWWSFIATAIIAACASVRKFAHIGWLTWVGFFSVLIAVFIIVIGVTTRDRPAVAPQTGDFDLGYRVIGQPTFAAGITAAATIFVSSAATSAFLPVISEMRKPKDYPKAVYLSMGFVTASYLAFSLVIYRWCGKWIASPALGSAGETIKRVSYGIALPGLIVSGSLYVHVAAKYLFVRLLRHSRHLQANTPTHWATWLGCTTILSSISFILACAIPIFTYVLALVGSICFAPLSISLPGWLWLYRHGHYWKKDAVRSTIYILHVLLVILGLFMTIGGTYGVIVQIMDAYNSGKIDKVFSCADNSGSV